MQAWKHRCFPPKFAKFQRTHFFTEHLRWLLLNDCDKMELQNHDLRNIFAIIHTYLKWCKTNKGKNAKLAMIYISTIILKRCMTSHWYLYFICFRKCNAKFEFLETCFRKQMLSLHQNFFLLITGKQYTIRVNEMGYDFQKRKE